MELAGVRIALLGGTGDIGEGLALRWAQETDHAIVIGSRDADKAARKADEYRNKVTDSRDNCTISGESNREATLGADVIVLAVPPAYLDTTIETIVGFLDDDAILVSPSVAMTRDDSGLHYDSPSNADSYTAVAAEAVPNNHSVVGAFHNISAKRLANLDAELRIDTLVVGDDPDATETVAGLAEEIEGIRAINAGAVANAKEVEAITPLLMNIAMQNEGMHNVGVRFQ